MCKCNITSAPDQCPNNICKKPHEHAALIKAWADGAIVECRKKDREKNWNISSRPMWSEDYEYRLQPVKKTIGELLFVACGGGSQSYSERPHDCYERFAEKFLAAVEEQENA